MQSIHTRTVYLYCTLLQAHACEEPTQDPSLLCVEDESLINTLLSEAAVLVLFGCNSPYKTDARWFPTLLQANVWSGDL